MSRRKIQYMMKNPKALMDYQLRGQLPREQRAPSTPLRDLIEQIPPRLRVRFRGVTLGPKLGFTGRQQFQTLEQVFNWLGGSQTLVGNQTLPYQSWQDRRFTRKLTVNDLLPHCADYPTKEVMACSLPSSIYVKEQQKGTGL